MIYLRQIEELRQIEDNCEEILNKYSTNVIDLEEITDDDRENLLKYYIRQKELINEIIREYHIKEYQKKLKSVELMLDEFGE